MYQTYLPKWLFSGPYVSIFLISYDIKVVNCSYSQLGFSTFNQFLKFEDWKTYSCSITQRTFDCSSPCVHETLSEIYQNYAFVPQSTWIDNESLNWFFEAQKIFSAMFWEFYIISFSHQWKNEDLDNQHKNPLEAATVFLKAFL